MRPLATALLALSLALAGAALPPTRALANPGPPFTVEVTDDWPQYSGSIPGGVTGKCISAKPGPGGPVPGPCTLRAAVTAANQLGGGRLTIAVPAGVYPLVNGDMRIDQVDLDIIGACCDAAGAPTTIVDGAGRNNDAFTTCGTGCGPGGNTINLSNLALRNFGAGAFWNSVRMNLNKILITNVRGEAIVNRGTMTLTDVSITGNQGTAIHAGGSVTATNLSVTNNTLTSGAPIVADGVSVTLTNSDVSNNVGTGTQAGGIYIGSNGQTVLDNVSITGNVLDPPGGGCCGPDPGSAAGLFITEHGQVTLTGGTIAGNSIASGARPSDTGGLSTHLCGTAATLSVNGTAIDSNSGSIGGIHVRNCDGSSAQLTGISLTNNVATATTSRTAGGMLVEYGPMTLVDSTVDGNSGPSGLAQAAGLLLCCDRDTYALSGITVSNNNGVGIGRFGPALQMTNSTISGNAGGGIDLTAGSTWGAGTVRLTNLTIAQNGAPGGLVYRYIGGAGPVELKNTIVATNGGANCAGEMAVTSLGSNLEGNDPGIPGTGSGTSCRFAAPGDQSNQAPLLAPLADNGGPTFTHALQPGSPAIDGVLSGCPPPTTDQRGVSRPQGPRCDVGAFELEPALPAAASAR